MNWKEELKKYLKKYRKNLGQPKRHIKKDEMQILNPKMFLLNGSQITNMSSITNKFNKYFTSVGSPLANQIDTSNNHPNNLHRLISAAIGRWVTSDPTELPFLPGRKKLCTRPVEYNPWVSKGKTQVSLRFIIKIQHINVFHMYDC